jgi:type 1 glutamine amidotransferase
MRTLVLCDNRPHPGRVVHQGLEALGDCGFEFDWIDNAGDWSAERMAGYPLVVMSKSNNVSAADERAWVTPEVQQAFLEYARAGHGILFIHSGMASYRELPVLRGLIGGVFIRHPKQCLVTVEPRPGHPLTAGSAPFTLMDEHYFMTLDDAEADLFMTTSSEHGAKIGGWTRLEGEGRVCVLSPGHNVEVWLHPSFQALLRNGLRWCAKLI